MIYPYSLWVVSQISSRQTAQLFIVLNARYLIKTEGAEKKQDNALATADIQHGMSLPAA